MMKRKRGLSINKRIQLDITRSKCQTQNVSLLEGNEITLRQRIQNHTSIKCEA